MKKEIKKEKNHAFGKDLYLLGKDFHNVKYWLEAPSWDCGWYWGFGYIETYTHNNPSLARDINSHQSIASSFLGRQGNDYIHNLHDSPILLQSTFTDKEGWELSELLKQFYLLSNMASFAHKDRPGCHIASSPVDHGDLSEWYKKINEEMIPRVTAAILAILTPVE